MFEPSKFHCIRSFHFVEEILELGPHQWIFESYIFCEHCINYSHVSKLFCLLVCYVNKRVNLHWSYFLICLFTHTHTHTHTHTPFFSHVKAANTYISQRIHAVWPVFAEKSIRTFAIYQTPSENFDQKALMHRLIWVLAWCIFKL